MISNRLIETCISAVGTRNIYICSVLEAARKGTRMKAEAKKKAARTEIVKAAFMPYKKKLELEKVGTLSPRIDDSKKRYPIDDVYFRGPYKWPIYTIEEAIEMHRETQHPTQLNNPTADVIGCIELSMSAKKKNQYIDEFSNIILLPHQFGLSHNRTILAICKDEEMVESIQKMDVTMTVGPEVVKMAEKGNIDFKSFEYILSHASILPDLIGIRSYLKNKFPTPRNGTAGMDLQALVTKFMTGIKYKVEKDKYDHDFAKLEVKIGTLDMDPKHIEENFKLLINDVEGKRPSARLETMITRVLLKCSNSKEKFKIDHSIYLPEEANDDEKIALKTAI